MPTRTRAFEVMGERKWSLKELAARADLPASTLYQIRLGRRGCGPVAIRGLLRAFPSLGYRDLFFDDDSVTTEPYSDGARAEQQEVAA
ncbi:MAG: hypothetical protein GEU71_03735 [Actinobacteria bacterium]|nr:hypothetical protein [Actinomycetota bacterium]